MTIINLKDFFYWHLTDEYIEVSDEIAAELRSDKRYESTQYQRRKRNKANYSLDVGDGIENSACFSEPSPQELLERQEAYEILCHALNSLPEIQGRRIDAHIILRKKLREIAEIEGVDPSAVGQAIQRGLRSMKKYLQNHL